MFWVSARWPKEDEAGSATAHSVSGRPTDALPGVQWPRLPVARCGPQGDMLCGGTCEPDHSVQRIWSGKASRSDCIRVG